MGDEARARVEGGSSALEGFAFRGRKGLLWLAENRPEELIRAFEMGTVNQLSAYPPQRVFETTWTHPMGWCRDIITMAINSHPMPLEKKLDQLDAAGDRTQLQKQALTWSRRIAKIGGVGILMTLLVLITAVLLLVLITVVGLLAGGTLIASAIYPVTMEEPIVWARLFLGIAFWAAAVAFSMPVLTDLMMILSGKSEEPEPPGLMNRILASVLERLGVRSHGLLVTPQTASRIRGLRKLGKRANIIVMSTVLLSILANVLGYWYLWAFSGILVWVDVDMVGHNEEILNKKKGFTSDMARTGQRLLNWITVGSLAFTLLFTVGSLAFTAAWDSATSTYQEYFGDGESPSEHNAKATAGSEDEESDARKRAREYLKKRGK